MTKQPAIYIISNKANGVLYIGVTSNLIKRIWQLKEKLVEGFSFKYNLDKLVYFETYETMDSAIVREKQLKTWKRDWKIRLIEESNPEWNDLYESIL
jgi:putative endonuclease